MTDIKDYILDGRFVIDMEDVKRDIRECLEDMRVIRLDKGLRDAAGPDFLRRLGEWSDSIEDRLNKEFSIVVIGDFKRGKSTFINALSGRYVAPSDVTPETVTINRITFGQEERCEAVLKNGRRMKLRFEELKRDSLDSIMQSINTEIEYIDIHIASDDMQGICIVDTPGVGDILNRFDKQVKDYLLYADAVIYVISALSPLSLSEQTFLCAAIAPQNFPRFTAVLNMSDCLDSEEEVKKVKGLVDQRLGTIFPNIQSYAVSGLDEYCLKTGKKRPNLELKDMLEANFKRLDDVLRTDVIMKKDIIQSERCLSVVKAMTSDLEKRIDTVLGMLDMDLKKIDDMKRMFADENSELVQSIEKHKESVRYDIQEMYGEAKGWMEEFLERLKNEIKTSRTRPAAELEKYFHFYLIDKVREATGECLRAHMQKINELTEKTGGIVDMALGTMTASEARIDGTKRDISWSNYDGAAVMLSFVPGIGDLAMLGQAALGYAKGKDSTKRQSEFIDNVLQNFSSIEESVIGELRASYDSMAESALDSLDKYYEEKKASVLEALRQAEILSDEKSLSRAQSAEQLIQIKTVLEQAVSKIKKYV